MSPPAASAAVTPATSPRSTAAKSAEVDATDAERFFPASPSARGAGASVSAPRAGDGGHPHQRLRSFRGRQIVSRGSAVETR
jgi:hypothetical protein